MTNSNCMAFSGTADHSYRDIEYIESPELCVRGTLYKHAWHLTASSVDVESIALSECFKS